MSRQTDSRLKFKQSCVEVVKTLEGNPQLSNQVCIPQKISNQHLVFWKYDLASCSALKMKKIQKEINNYSQIQHQNNLRLTQFRNDRSYSQVQLFRKANDFPILAQILSKRKLTDQSKKQLMKQLALGLHNVHQKGLTHNLINLETIYMNDKGGAVLEIPYFASIHSIVDSKQTYYQKARYYCASEVRLNEQLSQEGDIYALGVVFLQIELQKILNVDTNLELEVDSIKSRYFRSLIQKMLTKNPIQRPKAQQLYYYIQQFSSEDCEIAQLSSRDQVSIYKRNIFSSQTRKIQIQDLKISQSQEQMSMQVENGIVSMRKFQNMIKFNIKLYLARDDFISINFIEFNETIKNEEKVITNLVLIAELFRKKQLKIVINQSGSFEMLINRKKQMQIKVQELQKVAKQLNISQQQLRTYSQTYKKMIEMTDKLVGEQSILYKLQSAQRFWPQVCEQLLDQSKYEQALKLCRFLISRYGDFQYNVCGFGLQLETKWLRIQQIFQFYKATKKQVNPYDQLGLIGILSGSYTSNRLFLQKMRQKFPKNVNLIISLAIIQHNQQNYNKAVIYYDNALKQKPQLEIACILKNLCFYQNNKTAKQQIDQKLEFSSKDRGFYLERLLTLAKQLKSKDNVEIQLETMYEKSCVYPLKAIYCIFASLIAQKHFNQAQNYFRKFLKQDPQNPQIYKSIMEIVCGQQSRQLEICWRQRAKQQKLKKNYSIKLKEQLLIQRLNPNLPEKSQKELIKGQECLETGKFKTAILNYETYIGKFPEKKFLYFNLSVAYRRNCQYSESIQKMQKYVQFEPFDGEAYFIMGLNYDDLYQPKKAFKCFEISYQLQKDRNALDKIISYYNRNKIYDLEFKYSQKRVFLFPNDARLRSQNVFSKKQK